MGGGEGCRSVERLVAPAQGRTSPWAPRGEAGRQRSRTLQPLRVPRGRRRGGGSGTESWAAPSPLPSPSPPSPPTASLAAHLGGYGRSAASPPPSTRASGRNLALAGRFARLADWWLCPATARSYECSSPPPPAAQAPSPGPFPGSLVQKGPSTPKRRPPFSLSYPD